jgi:hypothetical protein
VVGLDNVAKPKLALESASEMQMALPMIGFDMQFQLDVQLTSIAVVVVPFR